MSQTNQDPATISGLELLVKVIAPKLIERVKNLEAKQEALEKQLADLLEATKKKPSTRKTAAQKKAEAEAQAAADLAADPTVIAAPDGAVAQAAAESAVQAAPVPPADAQPAADPQTSAAMTSEPPVVNQPAAVVAPLIVDNYPINGKYAPQPVLDENGQPVPGLLPDGALW